MADDDDDVGAALPATQPHPAPIFDTGPHPQPLQPLAADPEPSAPIAVLDAGSGSAPRAFPALAYAEPPEPSEPLPVPAQPVAVPGHDHHLVPWWKLLLILAAVWVPAAGAGLGLFYWWYSLADKTPAVFVVLVYIVACTVGALMLAMVQDKPLISALAIAVMTAVFASTAAAAPLYGHYYCQAVQGTCLAGIIPY
ncbi:hypothetical protein [Mycobacterium talmoniae]|uniref:Transmembrane protein n=1 Tax=Mycobacterium talmoniae TaxID=1858794 RepID=A0A1S1NKZ4_9MYCO|nr:MULTISPECIES: hypothetical protein [Mycobacterium]OHV04556.1 hypothetical protein BKN37_09325 [Mycobacterium talmoniae]TDH52893.1 hypothetical protein E2F47_13600 [Mycobacterium eburneum]